MPLPLIVSCSSKIQIGFTFLVPAHPGSPGQRAVKRVCVFVLIWASSMLHAERISLAFWLCYCPLQFTITLQSLCDRIFSVCTERKWSKVEFACEEMRWWIGLLFMVEKSPQVCWWCVVVDQISKEERWGTTRSVASTGWFLSTKTASMGSWQMKW